jgi:hypothetical protein
MHNPLNLGSTNIMADSDDGKIGSASPNSDGEDSDDADPSAAADAYMGSLSMHTSRNTGFTSNMLESVDENLGSATPNSDGSDSDGADPSAAADAYMRALLVHLPPNSDFTNKMSDSDDGKLDSGSPNANGSDSDAGDIRKAGASFLGLVSQGHILLHDTEQPASPSSSSLMSDSNDDADVRSAADAFFGTADVIETLYPDLDTNDYNDAVAAASLDFINSSDVVLDIDRQNATAVDEFFSSSQPMDVDSVPGDIIQEAASDNESIISDNTQREGNLSDEVDEDLITIPPRPDGEYTAEYFSFVPDSWVT